MATKQFHTAAIAALFLSATLGWSDSAIPPVPKLRLGQDVRPTGYSAELVILPERSNFTGRITIALKIAHSTSFFWLNNHGLTVSNAVLFQRDLEIPARPVIGSEEFVGFHLEKAARSGAAQLVIEYTGASSEKDFSGLFRRQVEGRWYAATQLESTWARRVFPCFDEPSFKVPWQLTLHLKRDQVAVSNTPLISQTPESNDMKRVRFAKTPPLPSYLIAVAVGPFDFIDLGKIGRHNTPVRIYTTREKTNQLAFAARAIPELLRRLEDYYGLPFPYPKLDHLAVPDFQGAMENAGLIIHDEGILLSPPDRETIQFKRVCADVCAHEMAHQWFGDLVTMNWWDDIWLNEAFATWITPKMVDQWQPAWNTKLDLLFATFGAMGADSLVSARRIRQQIEAEPDIDNAFDGITYNKGAAVLGMFESGLGPETFRRAIHAYLKAHAWKTATTADFLNALNHQAHRDVATAFSSFLDQSGVPLVSADLTGSSGGPTTLKLSQKRFLPVGSSGDVHRHWGIPLGLEYQSGGAKKQISVPFNTPEQILNLGTGTADLQWLCLNRAAAGYYVSAYHGQLLTNLLQAGSQLSSAERIDVAHSISAAVRSADVPVAQALSVMPTLLHDPERRVVTMAADFMNVSDRVPQELRTNYHRFIRRTLEPLIQGLSWESSEHETDDQRLQRLALLGLAANAGAEEPLINEAKQSALKWLADRKAVPPDEASAVLDVAGRYADPGLFEKLLAELKGTQDAADRQTLVRAIGVCKDPALAQRALEAVINREFQSGDALAVLFGLSSHVETRAVTYDFVKEHYNAVLAAIPGDAVFSYLPSLAQEFDTPERAADVEAFFKDKDPKLTGGPRIVAQTQESIHLNHAFKQAQLPSLVEFLKAQ